MLSRGPNALHKRGKIRIPTKQGFTVENYDAALEIIDDAFEKIYANNTEEISFEKTYHVVYNLVIYKRSDDLYNHLKELFTSKLTELKDSQFSDLNQDWEILQKVAEFWKIQRENFNLVADLMIYLDRVYCKSNRLPEIVDLALHVFRDIILHPLKEDVNKAISVTINQVRQTPSYGNSKFEVLKELISMLETISDKDDTFFETYFEDYFINETKNYYDNTISAINLPAPDLFAKIKDLIASEYSLDLNFLNPDTCTKIKTSIEEFLISEKFDVIFVPLIETTLKSCNKQLLFEVYSLINETSYRSRLLEIMDTIVFNTIRGIKIEESSKKRVQVASEWVSQVIDFYLKYQDLIDFVQIEDNENVDNDDAANESDLPSRLPSSHFLDTIFSRYINTNKNQAIQFICFYLDSYLRMTQNKEDLEKAKNNLQDCTKLFKLLREKDAFENTYTQLLSKRLIQQRSALHMERFMVKQIKDNMGSFFTSKMEGMLRDMSTSIVLSKSFYKNFVNDKEKIEFVPQVLTMTSWPFENINELIDENDVILPPRLEELKQNFEVTYSKKYGERVLKWAHTLGLVEIGFQFDKTYHELVMSTHAAAIFLMFEDSDEVTLDMLHEKTGIAEQELKRHLLSMVLAPRSKILRKVPNTRTISPIDRFYINYNFTAPVRKIKVQVVSGNILSSRDSNTAQTPNNSINSNEALERQRNVQTNAVLVRIMKSKRTSSFEELQDAATNALASKFTLPESTLKRSLNYLIEKEYIQRDSDDNNTYHYIP
ncbi:hypothetical protein KAFR_0F03290 [Kazachstania africana CBS 2517]|uniref:Cullin family profile domain-containing protein n=1 Tax=Kazachstania africana (strain ATCC 22294 / BCRC 22015 / CBS 2517 / CECT 1963 / NBRC 1671 / NRRL Y-8276) TaxID=1071382 RepID=H2AX25_KAZAF|nr:hypothetical protein KAFR_0F03290 [Kazachstania africana CBS 2517]CCF58925.1 hypothetical protein KAFR_0F03290 [Kazachstania africana CBS 2517]